MSSVVQTSLETRPEDYDLAASSSHLSIAWRRFRHHRFAMLGLILVGIIVLAAIFGPFLDPYGINDQDLFAQLQGPSAAHPLGTDDLGRDVLSRLLYGGRISLTIGISAALLSTVIGIVVGAVAGFYGGIVDNLLMRIVDLLLAFPSLFLLLILFAVIPPSATTVVIFLGAFGWLYLARIVRGEFLSLREKEFVEAARALGGGGFRIMRTHILPNVMAPVIVSTTLGIAYNMLAEATLSFLGFGVPPQIPTWGNMLTGAESYYLTVPLLAVYPGVALTIAILSINFIGDGLRDALDPRSTR